MAETNPLMDILKNVGETVSQAAPGLSLSNILSDVGAELGRLGVQGQMEAASALFNGNAFVPYGPGQYTPSNEKTVEAPVVDQPAIEEQSRGGRSM